MADYTTKEKDVQKGISRIPLDLARISDQDLINFESLEESKQKENHSISTKASSNIEGLPSVEIMEDDYESIINHRGKAYTNSRQSSLVADA